MINARHFLRDGERIIIIFTRGGLFSIREDHTGFTGNWKVNKDAKADRIIIYHRIEQTGINELYVATLTGLEPTLDNERSCVLLEHIQYAGKTELNWKEFAETNQYPVRYLS